jgi:protein-disulfide isomerase
MPRLTRAIGEEDHTLGPPDAQLTLVEYGDYACRNCRVAHGLVVRLRERLGDRLRYAYRNFPLAAVHDGAQLAAEAAEAAAVQGRFWEMHDRLYAGQEALTERDLKRYAGELSLDMRSFEQALASHACAERVRSDFMTGVRSGVNATPTFFVNGWRYDGPQDEEALLAALEREPAP